MCRPLKVGPHITCMIKRPYGWYAQWLVNKMQLDYLYSGASGRLKQLCPRGK
jgi:hypothetical protein